MSQKTLAAMICMIIFYTIIPTIVPWISDEAGNFVPLKWPWLVRLGTTNNPKGNRESAVIPISFQ